MFTSLNPGTLAISAPFEETLALARTNGFAGLDLPLAELQQAARQTSTSAVAERFSQAGVRPGGGGCPSTFVPMRRRTRPG